jgi:hypothetical protein
MKKIVMIAVLLTTLASCDKEEVITPENKQLRKSSISVSGQWVMQSYSINGVHTLGDNSVWNFGNGTLIIISQYGEEGFNYSYNGSRIYVIDSDNDIVLEYFIDYLDSSTMTLSIGNKTYTFTRY